MTNSSRVIGICGSPRKKGNTHTLVSEILAGAASSGAATSIVILDDLDIRPCKGCFACSKTHECIQNDDMNELVRTLAECPVWVLGTPIYWWGPTAQFKAFLDRWYHPKHQDFKNKRVVVVIPLGGGHERYASHTVGIFNDVLAYLNIDLFETLLAPGFNKRGEVKNDKKIMERARSIGTRVVKKKS